MTTATAPLPAAEAPRENRKIDWYRTPIDKELLKKLSQRSDLLGLQQALGYFGLYFGLIALAMYSFVHWHWAITVLIVYCHGTVAGFSGGCALHELIHNTVFKTRWLNTSFAKLAGLCAWWSPIWFQTSHSRHHAFTLHQPDDMEVTQPMGMPRGFKAWFWIVVGNPLNVRHTIRATWRTATGKVDGAWNQKLFPLGSPKQIELRNWARTLLIVHAAVLVASVAIAVEMQWYFLLLLPLMFSAGPTYGGWLGMLMGFPQHYGLLDNVPDYRLSCRTFTTNRLFGLLYWQMQYHTDHHMYPTVPCYHLKKLHAAIKHDLPPTPQGLIACWKEMWKIAEKQKENPNYLYRPPLPQDKLPASA